LAQVEYEKNSEPANVPVAPFVERQTFTRVAELVEYNMSEPTVIDDVALAVVGTVSSPPAIETSPPTDRF